MNAVPNAPVVVSQHPNPSPDALDVNNNKKEVEYVIGDLYQEEEGATLEFKGSTTASYDLSAFSYCFKNVVWEIVVAFINLHACEERTEPRSAKIVFGVHDRGYVQGIRVPIPPGYTKEAVLREKRDHYSLRLFHISRDTVQPPEIAQYVRFNMYEVSLPEGRDHEDVFAATQHRLPQKRNWHSRSHPRGTEEHYFYALAEVTVTIPTYPTVCSHRDIFWYRQPNAGCISRMTLQQLQTRFSHPAFRIIS